MAWDSQLSPVDTRKLQIQHMRSDRFGVWFEVSRAKTGRAAMATLSRRTTRLLEAYHALTPATAVQAAPVFRNRSGRPYSKDTLGDDFRDVRAWCLALKKPASSLTSAVVEPWKPLPAT